MSHERKESNLAVRNCKFSFMYKSSLGKSYVMGINHRCVFKFGSRFKFGEGSGKNLDETKADSSKK